MKGSLGLAVIALSCIAAAPAEDARATLVRAAFATDQKARAAALVDRALADLSGVLARNPGDRNALLQHGIGLGYKGQLSQSMGDAKRCRDILAGLVKRYPNDAEAWVSFGGWHTSVVAHVGGFVGSTVLGASRQTGLTALDRAVALGGNRAFFPAYAGLMRIRLSADDKQALPLLDRAAAAQTVTELDRITQTAARRVSAKLRAGDRKGASALAKTLLPFGRVA